MSYLIIAFNNAVQQLIESETRTSDPILKDLVVAHLKERGFYVRVREEG